MIRGGILIGAFVSLIVFPWPLSLVLASLASLSLPVAGIALGASADALYYVPGASTFPIATCVGLLLTIAALIVRHFMKAYVVDVSV